MSRSEPGVAGGRSVSLAISGRCPCSVRALCAGGPCIRNTEAIPEPKGAHVLIWHNRFYRDHQPRPIRRPNLRKCGPGPRINRYLSSFKVLSEHLVLFRDEYPSEMGDESLARDAEFTWPTISKCAWNRECRVLKPEAISVEITDARHRLMSDDDDVGRRTDVAHVDAPKLKAVACDAHSDVTPIDGNLGRQSFYDGSGWHQISDSG